MADAQANIGINLDASQALAQLKTLQRQISIFNTEIAKGGADAARSAANMQRNLINSINATGQFSASITKVASSADFFTNALEKNKLSLGQYFKYASAAGGKFSQKFSSELDTINTVARERVKDLQSQYIKLGRDADGSIRAIKVRPLMLDMDSLATKTAIAAQKQQLFNQLIKQGSTNLINWGKNTQWAGRQLMVGFTIPLTIFGATAAQEFMKIEEQAIRFKRVYGELFTTDAETNKALDSIQQLAMEFTKYGVAVDKTISLAADAAAMGKTGAELTAQVAEATRLAVLGGVEQQQALDTTISLTNAFGIAAEDLTNKIDFLNAVENQTVVSIEDLTIAIPKAGPVIQQLGGDVEDLAFFLTAMKEGGINASEGANALKSGLASLINPTERAKEMLYGFGINISGIVEANKGDVSGIILDFAKALDNLDPLNRAQAIEQLFGKFQFSRISTLFQNVIKDGTQAQRVLELAGASTAELASLSQSELSKLEQSPLFKFRAALEEFQAALAPVGEEFLKLATPFIEFGTKILNVFNNINDNAKGFLLGLMALIGAVGPVFLMTVGLMANGIGNMIAGFLNVSNIMKKLKGDFSETDNQISYLTQDQLEAATVASSLNQSHATLSQTFTSEASAIRNLIVEYQNMIAVQRSAFGNLVPATAPKPQGFKRGKKVPGYANGVVTVPGRKGEGDTQPAMLAPGEAVIPAKMAEKYGPLINAMIAGTIPGYKTGKNIKFAGQDFSIAGSEAQVAKILEFARKTASGLENGTDIVLEALRRIANDTSVTAKNFLRELESVSTNQFGNDFGQVSGAVGAGRTYKASASGKSGNIQQNLVSARGNLGQEEYDRALVAHQGALDALREHYTQLGLSEEEINKKLAKLNTVVRAHVAEVDSLGKMYAEGWDENLIVAQSEMENQLSNTLVESEPTRQLYLEKLQDENITEEQKKIIAEKITKNLALTEEELQIQKNILTRMLDDVAGMANVSKEFKAQAIGTIGAAEARAAVGPASPGVGERTPQEISVAKLALDQTVTRSISGEYLSMAQAEAAELATLTKRGTKIVLDAVHDGAVAGIAEAAQSSSPSRAAMVEGENIADGAIKGVRNGKDDMAVAGEELGQAAAAGTRAGQRGARLPGPVTPGPNQNIQLTGANVAAQAALVQSAFSQKLNSAGNAIGTFAENAAKGAKKLSGIGIAASSLVGAFAMIPGPVGDFAGKLFPLISAVTGLTFALQMLNAETIKATILGKFATAQKVFDKAISRGATNIGALGAVLRAAISPAGLVVAGLVVLGAGIYGLVKLMQAQQAKINGLGDAANLTASRLTNLGDKFGIQGSGAREATISAAQARATGTGVAADTMSAQTEIENTKQKFLELIDTDKEFKKEWKGTIDALKSGSKEASQASMEMLAVTLQTEGYAEEQIAGIISALLEQAGRTDVSIDFNNIDITTQQAAIDASAKQFVDSVSESIGRQKISSPIQYDEAALSQFSNTLASSIVNINAQFAAGTIGLSEYEAELDRINSVISGIATENVDAATVAVEALIARLEELGYTGLSERTAGLLANGTASGTQAAGAVAQATAAGVQVSDIQIQNLEAGTKADAGTRQQQNAQRIIKYLQDQTVAQQKLNAENQKAAEIKAQIEDLPNKIDEETDALNEQSSAFKSVNSFIKNNNKIKNKSAMATKIASDEILRLAFREAEAADAANGNTVERDKLINSLIAQEQAQAAVNATTAEADLATAIQEQQATTNVTDALGIALGNTADAQAIMNNAQLSGFIMSKLAAKGFDIATASAEDLAEALASEDIQSMLSTFKAAFGSFDISGSGTKGGGGGTPSSFLDDITKDFNKYVDASAKIGEGFDDSLKSIQNFAKVGARSTKGLASQLRNANVSEPLIEKILGMDPEEWEKNKNKLFEFDAQGNIAKLTAAGESVQKALNTATIAEYINSQKSATASISDQVAAYDKLVKAGASASVAYEMVQDSALASALAATKSTKDIKAAADAAIEAQKKQDELDAKKEQADRQQAIADAVKNLNDEFKAQSKILQKLQKDRKNYTDAQIEAILSNKDLRDLVLKPGIDQGALKKALDNANKQAELELEIKKLTVAGQEEIFQQGLSDAMSAFSAQENAINLEVDAKLKKDSKFIKDIQNQLDSIDFELGDYQAGIDEISRAEELINERYDQRFEALDRIAEINDQITASQQQQLTLADALSKGDIAAAARAAQEIKQQQSADSIAQQRRMVEISQRAEIDSLVSSSGMTRKQLEDKVRQLEDERFYIEQNSLRPAEERIRLGEVEKQNRIDQLTVLGKTRSEWEQIQSQVDLAQANGWKFAESMKQALSVLNNLLGGLGSKNFIPKLKVTKFNSGGMVKYMASGGSIFKPSGSDIVPAMLTPGEFVIRKSAVDNFGSGNLNKINNGTYDGNSVYNYNLAVNVKSDANPDQIARTVMSTIKQVEGRRIRGNNL